MVEMQNLNKKIIIFLAIFSTLLSTVAGVMGNAQGAQTKYNVARIFHGNDDAYGKYKSAQFSDVTNNTKAITRMAALNVTTGADTKYFPGNYETKEQALASLIKLKGISVNPYSNSSSASVSSQFNCSSWAIPYINAAISAGIITKASTTGVNFSMPATKEETAYWVCKVVGIAPSTNTIAANMIKDATKINPTYEPYVESLLLKGIMWNTGQKYFNPTDVMRRSEFADLLDIMLTWFPDKLGYKIINGQVIDIVNSDYTSGFLINKTRDYYVKLDDGSINDFRTETLSSKLTRDFLVYKNNKLGFSGILRTGDYMYCIAKDSKILFIEVTGNKVYDSSAEGNIVSKDDKSFMIQTGNGHYQTFSLTQYTTVSVNGESAKSSDLMIGENVTVNYYGNYAREINVYSRNNPSDNPGEDSNGKSGGAVYNNAIVGTVEALNNNSITIDCNGVNKEYQISSDQTQVMNDGSKASIYDIKPGDVLKLTVDSANMVSNISIQAFGGTVKEIIKGKLLDYNDLANTFSLKDVYILKNGQWTYTYPQVVYNIADDAQIYANGKNLSNSDIENQLGGNLYAAVVTDKGDNLIEKVNFKSGTEMAVNSQITDVNTGLQRIKIGNGNNINIDNGTIIVYNNKLASSDLLSKNDYLFTAIGKNPTTNINYANMIYVNMPGMNNFMEHYKLYMGRLSTFDQSSITIDTSSQFKNNKWVGLTTNIPSITINTDAKIFDSVTNKFIDMAALMGGNYIIDQNNNPWNNQSYYAYVITDENNVMQGMYLMSGAPNILSQKIRYGTITNLVDDAQLGKVMTVVNNLQWSDISNSWNSIYNNINLVNISKSLVFKDGQLTDADSLSVDDNVLFMTDANRTCIFVR